MLLAAAFARIIFTAIHERRKESEAGAETARGASYSGRMLFGQKPALCPDNCGTSSGNFIPIQQLPPKSVVLPNVIDFSLKRAISATSEGPVRITSRDRGL
jgi:hypothetical protein